MKNIFLILMILLLSVYGCSNEKDINDKYPSDPFRLDVSESADIDLGSCIETISYGGIVSDNTFSIVIHGFKKAYNLYYPIKNDVFQIHFYNRVVLLQIINITNKSIELIIVRVDTL